MLSKARYIITYIISSHMLGTLAYVSYPLSLLTNADMIQMTDDKELLPPRNNDCVTMGLPYLECNFDAGADV